MRFVFVLISILLPLRAFGTEPALLCERASQIAASESGVPVDILTALTLTETGRHHDGITRPWAWSVNVAGKGSWYNNPDTALAYVKDHIKNGHTNIDIGCFQINYFWHGRHFYSAAEMFEPLANARYAARFVKQLYAETGDWRQAAGAFHSRTPHHAKRYLARFDEFHAALRKSNLPHLRVTSETYNRFTAQNAPAALPVTSDSYRQRSDKGRQTLLGAPSGTSVTGMPGSLAAIGDRQETIPQIRGALLGSDNRGPLFGNRAVRITRPQQHDREYNRQTRTPHTPSDLQVSGEILLPL